MAPIRYSLHYEDYSDHLMSRFGKLLQMQSLVDMTLMCSSHTLRVHKAVLAASSAYFQAWVTQVPKQNKLEARAKDMRLVGYAPTGYRLWDPIKNKVVISRDEVLQKQNCEPLVILKMRFSVLKCLVEFMYCGKTQCLEENLDELVAAAQFLKIKGLSKVTKEGLGITNTTELPIFTPPVVINRPPKSLLQDNIELKKVMPGTLPPMPSSSEHPSPLRSSKDPSLRMPYDLEVDPLGLDYPQNPPRYRPRRGRPSSRRISGWESPPVLGRAAERALLKREHDSRKAINQLKNLQSRQMQASHEFVDRVTLTQAVNSICPSDSSSDNYMNFDSDLLYLDQNLSSNILDPNISLSKNNSFMNDSGALNFNHNTTNKVTDECVGSTMSEYVNALKSAGLPTDLPILLESGDGSYINVNEKVLMDMVQNNEIQYEVIEQPNIIDKVVDPSEIKSIDELSKSIERNELIGVKSMQSSFFERDSTEFLGHDEAINSLNAILPSNLDSFSIPDNFSTINPSNNNDTNNDISSIVNDMFSKSITDSEKNAEQICTVSSNLDTTFNMSFLDSKVPHFEPECMEQDYHRLNTDDLRQNVDCYDFSLNLSQPTEFKDSDFDCLMDSPRKLENSDKNNAQIYSDLIDIRSPLQGTPEFSNDSKLNPKFIEHLNQVTQDEKDSGNKYELKDFEKELDSLKSREQETGINSLEKSQWKNILNSDGKLDIESDLDKDTTDEFRKKDLESDYISDNPNICNLENVPQETSGNKRSRDKNESSSKHSKRKTKSRKCE